MMSFFDDVFFRGLVLALVSLSLLAASDGEHRTIADVSARVHAPGRLPDDIARQLQVLYDKFGPDDVALRQLRRDVARKRELVLTADGMARRAILNIQESAYNELGIVAELKSILGEEDHVLAAFRQAVVNYHQGINIFLKEIAKQQALHPGSRYVDDLIDQVAEEIGRPDVRIDRLREEQRQAKAALSIVQQFIGERPVQRHFSRQQPGLLPTNHPDLQEAEEILSDLADVFGRYHPLTLMLRRQMHSHLFSVPWADEVGIDDFVWWALLALPEGNLRFRFIPPGAMHLGSEINESGRQSDESRYHVVFSEGFWLAETETSQLIWNHVMPENPSHFSGARLPVETVSWHDVQTFVEQLNDALGIAGLDGFRLPTEAEWEYACRAGQRLRYSSGEQLDPAMAHVGVALVDGEGQNAAWLNEGHVVIGTLPCGSLQPNAWGLHDMHGNVWEWVADAYGPYPTGTVRDPLPRQHGATFVFRGGSWYVAPIYARSASRAHYSAKLRRYNVGFRLAIDGVSERRP